VRVTCSGRADPGHGERLVRTLQLVRTADGAPAFSWRGRPPVTSFAHADGGQTFQFQCGTCRRNPKLSGERLAQIVLTAAAVHGWDAPIVVDLSLLERAI
jgi:hypothetical protein